MNCLLLNWEELLSEVSQGSIQYPIIFHILINNCDSRVVITVARVKTDTKLGSNYILDSIKTE